MRGKGIVNGGTARTSLGPSRSFRSFFLSLIPGVLILLLLFSIFNDSGIITGSFTRSNSVEADNDLFITGDTKDGSNEDNLKNWCNDVRITYNMSSSTNPTLAIDRNNDIHVTWQDNREGNWEIYYLKLSEKGAKLINDMRLTNDSAASVNPKIMLGEGENKIHLIWSDNGTGSWEIYHMALTYNNDTIEVLSDKKQISDADPADSSFPDVVMNGGGTIKVAWQDLRHGNWEIYFCVVDDTGAVIVSDTRVTVDDYQSTRCSIDVDSYGNTHIVCHEYRNASGDIDTNYGIHYFKLNSDGTVVLKDNRLSIASKLSWPVVRVDSEDRVHVVFDDTRYNDAGFSDIIYTMLDSNGTTLIDDVTITPSSDSETTPVDSREPAMTIDFHNILHIIWMDNRDGYYGIYYTMLDPNNYTAENPLPLEEQITLVQDMKLTSYNTGSQAPSISIDSNSNLHLVWQDERSGSWELFYIRTDKPDLVIENGHLGTEPENPTSGDPVTVEARIYDTQGSGLIETTVNFYYVEESALAGYDISNLSGLALYDFQELMDQMGVRFASQEKTFNAGESIKVSDELNTSGLRGNVYVSAVIDFNRVVDEINDRNNFVIKKIFINNYSLAMDWIGSSSLETAVNSSVGLSAEISNTGNGVNEISFEIADGGLGWFSVTPEQMSLDVNGSADVSLDASVPIDAPAGVYNITLAAVPVKQPDMTSTLVMSLTVLQFANVTLDTLKSRYNVVPGYSIIPVNIGNYGNGKDTISLGLSSENGWKCMFEGSDVNGGVTLSQNEERLLLLNVSVPNSSPDIEDNITVTATSTFDNRVKVKKELVLVVQAKRMVKVTTEEDFMSISSNEAAEFKVSVSNMGNVVDWYEVHITLPRFDWNATAGSSSLNISAGAMENITISIIPPSSAFGKIYEIFVVVNSTVEDAVISTLKLEVNIKTDLSFTILPDAPQVKEGKPLMVTEYRYTIHNTGNVNNTLYLTLDSGKYESWWFMDVTSTSYDRGGDQIDMNYTSTIYADLVPNERKKILIQILPPQNSLEGTYNFTFEATGVKDGDTIRAPFALIIENATQAPESSLFLTITIAITALTALIIVLAIVVRWYRGRK